MTEPELNWDNPRRPLFWLKNEYYFCVEHGYAFSRNGTCVECAEEAFDAEEIILPEM